MDVNIDGKREWMRGRADACSLQPRTGAAPARVPGAYMVCALFVVSFLAGCEGGFSAPRGGLSHLPPLEVNPALIAAPVVTPAGLPATPEGTVPVVVIAPVLLYPLAAPVPAKVAALPAPVPPPAERQREPEGRLVPSRAARTAPSSASAGGAPASAMAAPAQTLDVAGLKARLRDTGVIGLFTKIALKNQVDDLLGRFRMHYRDAPGASVAPLRQPYDLLLMKVLVLVQEGDPPLARMISGSREAIWLILADPEKFRTLA